MDNKRKVVGKVHSQTYRNGVLIEENSSPIYEIEEEIKNDNIGIGFISPYYIEVNELQDKHYEYSKISKFLKKYLKEYALKNNMNHEDLNIEFINYGKTELVYVLTEKSGKRVTILTKQPAVEFGKVKQEADNLIRLNKVDDSVVAPLDYYKYGDQELYVTPYINQARCVASDSSWGMYVPEPIYRFVCFNKKQERIVNICMIAKLVSLYDFKTNEGIASLKLGGGDFMLAKGWKEKEPTIDDTLKSLYFIAAREMINLPFEDYLNIIRDEFSRRTIDENQEELLLNHRGRVAMDINDIEEGIKLGKKLIKDRKNKICR